MTRLFDDPGEFAEDAVAGFVDLYEDVVRKVEGGVVRRALGAPEQVAVVIGGGSGHYPAFAGYVGPGLASGAVIGDVFASPSTSRVVSVAKAAANGGGVLLAYGNYAGDVLNFKAAADQLRSGGMEVETIAVTDDLASAPPAEASRRRGVAGDVVVFKIAGAAAAAGYRLEDVRRVADRANDRVRTLGVAFSGCTVPGAKDPSFTVAAGSMAVGLGVHGEPGIATKPLMRADELAALLVDAVRAEAADPSERHVAVILNGLGATKYEELFVLWRSVSRLLKSHGMRVVSPLVGELVTSLDMAGCSLTVCWLDDELEGLWLAPAQTPALSRGEVIKRAEETGRPTEEGRALATAAAAPAAQVSQAGAACLVRALGAVSDSLAASEERLGRLDSYAGDGDHGRSMSQGARAACAAANNAERSAADAAAVVTAAADAWTDRAGGTSGALWGLALRAFAGQLSDAAEITSERVCRGVEAALEAIQNAGHASIGDKTIVDALDPFCRSLRQAIDSGSSLHEAWSDAADVASEAAKRTAQLRPRLGRARPLAEQSLGHEDPGAVSLAISLQAIAATLA